MQFVIYELSTGIIKNTLQCPDFLLYANTPSGCSALVDDDSASSLMHCVDITTTPHTIVAKTPINYSINKTTISPDSADVAVISGLPSGAQALFENELHAVPSGVIEIDADVAGEYIIVLKHPLYLDTTIVVTAE